MDNRKKQAFKTAKEILKEHGRELDAKQTGGKEEFIVDTGNSQDDISEIRITYDNKRIVVKFVKYTEPHLIASQAVNLYKRYSDTHEVIFSEESIPEIIE